MKKQPMVAHAVLTLSLTAGAMLASANLLTVSQAAPHGQRASQSATRPNKSTTNSSTTTVTPRPTPVAGSGDIRLIGSALGRTLTTTEQAAITTAATTRDATLANVGTTFDSQLAVAVGLSVTELQTALRSYRPARTRNSPPDLITVLETVLNRDLTDEEEASVELTITTRDAAIQAAVGAYRTAVAAAVGLSLTDLDAAITAYISTNCHGGKGGKPGGRPAGGGKDGHCAPPATSGTGTGSTTGTGTTGTTTGGTTAGGYY